MFCPTCGTRAVEFSRFCHHCSTPLPLQRHQFDQPVNVLPAEPIETVPPKRDNRTLKALIYTGGFVVLFCLGIGVVVKETSRSRKIFPAPSTASNSLASTVQQTFNEVVKTEQRRKLLSESQVVAPGQFWWQGFDITPGMQPTRVEGHFVANGGSGNDILIYIVDEVGLANVRNGHRTKLYYNSRQVTAGEINIELSAGKYYLVMDNTFSLFSNKVVRNDIELVYQQ